MNASTNRRPAAVDAKLYPFDGHLLDRGGLAYHYLDEGPRDAAPVLMVHGNPTWSFYYRELVLALRSTHRCVVPDHIGCGLSDKPGDDRYRYTLASRVDDLTALVDALGLERVSLVVHDWGGMIGTAWATRHPDRVDRVVAMNTAAFTNPKGTKVPPSLWLARNTVLGAGLVRGLNAFAEGAVRTCTTRRPLPPDVARAYVAPYDSWDNRIATLRFVQDIPLSPSDPAWAVVAETEAGLSRLASKPVQLHWGLRDFVFDEAFLHAWERHFPAAEVFRYSDCGHYVLEDAGDEIIPRIARFVRASPS